MSGLDPTPLTLPNVRAHLINRGLVRDPRIAGSLPPCWIQPRDGAPAPNEGDSVERGDPAVSIFRQPGIAPRPYEEFIRQDAVEFVVRASRPDVAENFEKDVRVVLNGQRGWIMSTLRVEESMLFRDLQMVDSGNEGFTYTFEYMFHVWGPYVPVP